MAEEHSRETANIKFEIDFPNTKGRKLDSIKIFGDLSQIGIYRALLTYENGTSETVSVRVRQKRDCSECYRNERDAIETDSGVMTKRKGYILE